MKKALFGTSAIAGAAVLAAGSAFAGEAPQVTFSGAVAFDMIIADGGIEDAGTGFAINGNEQQSELAWDARGTADNGLEYGANIQWRWMNSNSGNFDEAFLDFRGSFGRIYLGAEDTVTDLVAGTAGHSVQVGTWGTDGNNALRSVDFRGLDTGLLYYASSAGLTSDANKIGYITPNFGGFQAGVSFTPQGGRTNQQSQTDDPGASNVVDIAAGWGGEIGGVGLNINGSYQFGDDDSSAANSATANQEREEIGSYMLGAQVNFAGLSVAAGYVDNDDSGCVTTTNGCDDGDAWNIGASYGFGAGNVSVMYQTGEQDRDGDGLKSEAQITHVGASFSIAEGLSTYANYYYMNMVQPATDGRGVTSIQGNHANVLILGTRVTF